MKRERVEAIKGRKQGINKAEEGNKDNDAGRKWTNDV